MLISTPEVVNGRGLGALAESAIRTVAVTVAPIAAVCMARRRRR